MKWLNKGYERFSKGKQGLRGRKNNNTFEIISYTKGFSYEHLGWFISIHNTKTDKRFNSLWKDIWFKEIQDAKQWCENFNWETIE